MAGMCPHCGASNPDDLPFCNSCGKPIQADLRLIMDLERSGKRQEEASRAARRDEDDDLPEREDEEKKFPVLPVVLALAAAAALLWFILR